MYKLLIYLAIFLLAESIPLKDSGHAIVKNIDGDQLTLIFVNETKINAFLKCKNLSLILAPIYPGQYAELEKFVIQNNRTRYVTWKKSVTKNCYTVYNVKSKSFNDYCPYFTHAIYIVCKSKITYHSLSFYILIIIILFVVHIAAIYISVKTLAKQHKVKFSNNKKINYNTFT